MNGFRSETVIVILLERIISLSAWNHISSESAHESRPIDTFCDRVYLCSKKHVYIVPVLLPSMRERMRLYSPLEELWLPPPFRAEQQFSLQPWDMAKELFDPRERETLRLCIAECGLGSITRVRERTEDFRARGIGASFLLIRSKNRNCRSSFSSRVVQRDH